MSSDTSPPSGYRLEDPARTGAEAGGAVPRQRPSEPSWLKVIATTVRLWVRRKVLHVPDSAKIGTLHRGRLAVVLAVIVVVAGAGIATGLALTGRFATASRPVRHAAAAPKLTPAQQAARAAAAAAGQANGRAAARWVAVQVAGGSVIGCDPVTCAAILAAGYPTGGQVVLEPGASLPGPGSVIVATAAVRAQYGSRLASSAPVVIAAFGAGSEAVQVRLAVPGGAPGYSQAARSARAARTAAGRKLLHDSKVHADGATRSQLASGRVDPRLTTVLHLLAARYPVYLEHFGDAGPLAAASVPYRVAYVAVLSLPAGHHKVSDLSRMEALLTSQPAGYRAELTPKHLGNGKYVLQIMFPAPSPF